MKVPKLKGEALAYWKRHAPILEENGRLTDSTRDSFTLLCRIWATLHDLDTAPGEEQFRSMTQFDKLLNRYQQYASKFGVIPNAGSHPPGRTESLSDALDAKLGE